MREELNYRMYFFVPYNILDIQKGIQAGHVVEQYAANYKSAAYDEYVKNHKTWIILSGGSTNNSYNVEEPGHMGNIKHELENIGVDFATFYEPDLNDALSGICFLASDQVYDYESYPDLPKYAKDHMNNIRWMELFKNGPVKLEYIKEKEPEIFANWEKSLGGMQNVRLRYLLKGKSLA